MRNIIVSFLYCLRNLYERSSHCNELFVIIMLKTFIKKETFVRSIIITSLLICSVNCHFVVGLKKIRTFKRHINN